MVTQVKEQAKEKMDKTVHVLKQDLTTIRAGRANPSILDKVTVEYYGAVTPLNQVANISSPEPRSLLIQPWDPTIIGEIEKAILRSELGFTPSNDGSVIRIVIPVLTEERRNELIKVVKKTGEEAKVVIRNIRRDANDGMKKLEKKGEVPEDVARRGQDEIQKLTDQYVQEIDRVVANKEKEMLEI